MPPNCRKKTEFGLSDFNCTAKSKLSLYRKKRKWKLEVKNRRSTWNYHSISHPQKRWCTKFWNDRVKTKWITLIYKWKGRRKTKKKIDIKYNMSIRCFTPAVHKCINEFRDYIKRKCGTRIIYTHWHTLKLKKTKTNNFIDWKCDSKCS